METQTETQAKKVKQITVNVSDADKVKLNELKEKLGLTDKEVVSVLLEVVGSTDEAVVTSLVEKVQKEKAVAAVQARLAKLVAKQAELKAQIDAETAVVAEAVQEA